MKDDSYVIGKQYKDTINASIQLSSNDNKQKGDMTKSR